MNYEDAVGVMFIFLVLSFSNKHALLCFGILVLMLLSLYSLNVSETFDSTKTKPENNGQTTILLCVLLLIVMFLKRVI